MTWLRLDEAQVAAGISRATIYRWINSGLEARKTPDGYIVHAETLEQWRAWRDLTGTLPSENLKT